MANMCSPGPSSVGERLRLPLLLACAFHLLEGTSSKYTLSQTAEAASGISDKLDPSKAANVEGCCPDWKGDFAGRLRLS